MAVDVVAADGPEPAVGGQYGAPEGGALHHLEGDVGEWGIRRHMAGEIRLDGLSPIRKALPECQQGLMKFRHGSTTSAVT